MSKWKSALMFVAGAVAGAIVAHTVTKQKYEDILEEEIASVKETYKNRKPMVVNEIKEDVEEEQKVGATPEEKAEMEEYKSILKEQGYTNYTKYMNTDEKDKDEDMNEQTVNTYDDPYVIEPEEFGEDGYDTQTLTFYNDGVLVDDLDEVIPPDDWDALVGRENLKVFDEYGATSVMVRNEHQNIDFEIIKDDWDYASFDVDHGMENIQEKKPHEV